MATAIVATIPVLPVLQASPQDVYHADLTQLGWLTVAVNATLDTSWTSMETANLATTPAIAAADHCLIAVGSASSSESSK